MKQLSVTNGQSFTCMEGHMNVKSEIVFYTLLTTPMIDNIISPHTWGYVYSPRDKKLRYNYCLATDHNFYSRYAPETKKIVEEFQKLSILYNLGLFHKRCL